MEIILLIIVFVFFFSLVFLMIKYLFIPFLFAPKLSSDDVIEFLENQELVFVDERGLNKEESKLNPFEYKKGISFRKMYSVRKEFIVVGYSVSKKEYTFYWAELTQWYVFYMKYIFEILSSQAIGSSENLIFKKIEDSNLIDKLTNEFKSPIKLIKDNCPGCNCSIDEKTLECPNCGLNLIIKG